MNTDVTPTTYPAPVPPSAFLMGINGFDEIAIAAHFGAKVGDLREDPVTLGRALAFVQYRRDGATDPEAYKQSMTLTMQGVVDFFPPEPKPDPAQDAEGNAP